MKLARHSLLAIGVLFYINSASANVNMCIQIFTDPSLKESIANNIGRHLLLGAELNQVHLQIATWYFEMTGRLLNFGAAKMPYFSTMSLAQIANVFQPYIAGLTKQQREYIKELAQGRSAATMEAWGLQTNPRDLISGVLHWMMRPEQTQGMKFAKILKTDPILKDYARLGENFDLAAYFEKHGNIEGFDFTIALFRSLMDQHQYSPYSRGQFTIFGESVKSGLAMQLFQSKKFIKLLKMDLSTPVEPGKRSQAAEQLLRVASENIEAAKNSPEFLELFQLIKKNAPNTQVVVTTYDQSENRYVTVASIARELGIP